MFDDFDTQQQIDEFIPEEWENIAYENPINFIMGFAAMCTTARKIANKKKSSQS